MLYEVCFQLVFEPNKDFKKAAVGGVYDPDRNAFADPQIYDSWTLDQNTGKWEPPTARPDETGYFWNESQQKWLRN